MAVKRLLIVLSCLSAVAWTHPDGVPLEYPNICQTMLPSHNGTTPKSTEEVAPFSIIFNATCYSASVPVNVTILAEETARFIGFFVEARKPGQNSFSYGTFDSNGDRHIKTLRCFNKEASAVCQYNPALRARNVRHAGHEHHHEHAKWTTKTFKWTPPNDISDDLEFVATVIKEYNEFWVGIKSERVLSCLRSKSSSIHLSILLAALLATGSLCINFMWLSNAV